MTSAADTFMFDRAAETMPRADLAALQLKRLRATIERAITSDQVAMSSRV